jgi:hypothetical protein
MPTHCASKACHSRKWNSGAPEPIKPSNPIRSLNIPGVFLGMPAEDPPEPSTRPQCTYKEYDTESGEWYGCRLLQHGPKIKHQRGPVI